MAHGFHHYHQQSGELTGSVVQCTLSMMEVWANATQARMQMPKAHAVPQWAGAATPMPTANVLDVSIIGKFQVLVVYMQFFLAEV